MELFTDSQYVWSRALHQTSDLLILHCGVLLLSKLVEQATKVGLSLDLTES